MKKIFHTLTNNRYNTALIKQILSCPTHARGFYYNNPKYMMNCTYYVLNRKLTRILYSAKLIEL